MFRLRPTPTLKSSLRAGGIRPLTTASRPRLSAGSLAGRAQPSPLAPRFPLPLRGSPWRVPMRSVTSTVVGAPLRKKVTTLDLMQLKRKNKPISMVTAYTYPSALHVDTAGIDVLLVGDSLAMVEHGHDTTLPVTMDDMLLHARAVARGAQRALLVGDMPFGSYEESDTVAVRNGIRYLKEGGMDCVKLEGGGSAVGSRVRALLSAGVGVMGHIGLTPQKISVLGGFRAQGRTADAALQLIDEALKLQEAGCFAVVIECVPSVVAARVTEALTIPTIGIGSGPHTSGQVLVYHDLLGMLEHAHHAHVVPRFSKMYASLGQQIQTALEQYRAEVDTRAFPSEQYAPYKMNAEETKAFEDAFAAKYASSLPTASSTPATASATTSTATPKKAAATTAATKSDSGDDGGVIPKLY